MLDVLDKELEARGLHFTRYADDCIILVGSSKAADRVMENVSKFIEKKLGFKVNMTKSKVSKPNEIKYLEFGFFKDKTDVLWKAKPHEKSIEKLKLKLKELTKKKLISGYGLSIIKDKTAHRRMRKLLPNRIFQNESN